MKRYIIIIIMFICTNAEAYIIFGYITGQENCEVNIELYKTACGKTTLTNIVPFINDNSYYFIVTQNVEYTVLPKSDICTYSPESRDVTIAGSSQTGIDFAATAIDIERFIDNGDGTITDTDTNHVWLKDAGCFPPSTLSDAKVLVMALDNGTCGLSDNSSACDWYIPSKVQLQRLGTDPPYVWWYFGKPDVEWVVSPLFMNINDMYWTTNGVKDIPSDVWNINMTNGFIAVGSKTELFYTLPVRNKGE